MICFRCSSRLSSPNLTFKRPFPRLLSTTTPPHSPSNPPAATSTSAAQPFSTPFTPSPSKTPSTPKSPDTSKTLPKSSLAAGSPLRGLNYIKNAPPLLAREDTEYPSWLWECLTPKRASQKQDTGSDITEGDPFGSKKQRRLARKSQAANRQGDGESRAGGAGSGPTGGSRGDVEWLDELDQGIAGSAGRGRVPLEEQSVDLRYGHGGTKEGEVAARQRQDLTERMRRKRRTGIREANFLRSMR